MGRRWGESHEKLRVPQGEKEKAEVKEKKKLPRWESIEEPVPAPVSCVQLISKTRMPDQGMSAPA